MKYVSAKEAKKYFLISGLTLKVWKDTNKILTKQFSLKKILYDIDSVNNITDNRKNVIYARVSCSNLKLSLDNLIELIKSYMISRGIKVDDIYAEIASGINEDRNELSRLIHDIDNELINKVYITFKDRLTRFGFNYLKSMFENHGTEIIVLDNNEDTNEDYKNELVEDLISIIHRYSNKLYSNRIKKLKEIEKILKNE